MPANHVVRGKECGGKNAKLREFWLPTGPSPLCQLRCAESLRTTPQPAASGLLMPEVAGISGTQKCGTPSRKCGSSTRNCGTFTQNCGTSSSKRRAIEIEIRRGCTPRGAAAWRLG